MSGKTVNEINIGDRAESIYNVTEQNVIKYAEVSEDFNPIHLNEEYAQKTRFKGRIVHGMLLGGLISGVIGTKLPGEGCIYISQTINFRYPVRIGDVITTTIEVIEKNPVENRILLSTTCCNQNNRIVLDGKAVIMPVL